MGDATLLDLLLPERFEPDALRRVDRKALAALALVRELWFAAELKAELKLVEPPHAVRVLYPLGEEEVQTVFAYQKHKKVLEYASGTPPPDRRRKREAERALEAAHAAAPEVLALRSFPGLAELAAAAVPQATALRRGVGLQGGLARPVSASDFRCEVVAEGAKFVVQLRGIVVGPAAMHCGLDVAEDGAVLVSQWVEGGTLDRRLRHPGRIGERDVVRWASNLAKALAATHHGGYVYGALSPSTVQLAHAGVWQEDAAAYQAAMEAYEARRKESTPFASSEERPDEAAAKKKKRKKKLQAEADGAREPSLLPARPGHCHDALLSNFINARKRDARDVDDDAQARGADDDGSASFKDADAFSDDALSDDALSDDASQDGASRGGRRTDDVSRASMRPWAYEPPEGFHSAAYGSKADVWALGCVIFEVATRVPASQHAPASQGGSFRIRDTALDNLVKSVPARFPMNVKLALRCALDPDPSRRASAEELFYVLDSERAKRRHAVRPMRAHFAELLGLGAGGYESHAEPLLENRLAAQAERRAERLRMKLDKEETASFTSAQTKGSLTSGTTKGSFASAQTSLRSVAGDQAPASDVHDAGAEARPSDSPQASPRFGEEPVKAPVFRKTISAASASRLSATQGEDESDDGASDLDLPDDLLSDKALLRRARKRFEASLSPEALAGWKRAIERVKEQKKKDWWANLPGPRRRRAERRRQRAAEAQQRKRDLAVARHCALVTFWGVNDVAKWARLGARRAVDCEALSLLNREGWFKRQQNNRVARIEAAAHRKAQKLPPSPDVADEDAYAHKVFEGVGKQPMAPAALQQLVVRCDAALKSGDDSKRQARRLIAEFFDGHRNSAAAKSAAQAAFKLCMLDLSARRYCDALASALQGTGVTGKDITLAMRDADATAETSMQRLKASNARWQAGSEPEAQAAARVTLTVSALAKSEQLCDALRDAANTAEVYGNPRDESADDEALPAAALPERDRQAYVLALVLHVAFRANQQQGLVAREHAAAQIQARGRGARVRRLIKQVWREADVLARDELRAAAAATAAMEAIARAVPVEKPKLPPPVVLECAFARAAHLGLSAALRLVAEKVGAPLDLQGWLSESTSDGLGVVVLELGGADDGGENAPALIAAVEGLRPATTYSCILRLTAATRKAMRRAARGTDAALPAYGTEHDRAVLFTTQPDAPDAPGAPVLNVVRLRPAHDLVASSSASKQTKPIVAVHVRWDAPPENGAAIETYACERRTDAPTAKWHALKRAVDVFGGRADLVDVPPAAQARWWYRVAARNWVGLSDFGPATSVDIVGDASAAPFYEAPAPAPARASAVPEARPLPRLLVASKSALLGGVFFNVPDLGLTGPLPSSKPGQKSTFR
ncbi:hypothetical protein M885DRAFT_582137 [Pelagophyceae sp. CCMP2097]|nr:hypothetical protein M885DRAFT_582137 [Pelagophyceae sp. CCMP2097]